MTTEKEMIPADLKGPDGSVNRREAIRRGATVSGAIVGGFKIASIPMGMAAIAGSAAAQNPDAIQARVTAVLQFALTLEFLEAEFYNIGMATSGLIPRADFEIFKRITDHENAHVRFLQNALGSAAPPKPTFDFTAGNGSGSGPYATVFSDYNVFMAVAQAFEDTGVRAYKGQAPALSESPAILEAALSIHSVEARHASMVRRLRGNFQETAPNKGWITGEQTDVPGSAATYAGEGRTVQLGVDISAFVSVAAATEAFDEPLTKAQVMAIVDPFIV
ncbi:MAG: ferritin-like domain-containing protein [Gemmatimonadota bacterium]